MITDNEKLIEEAASAIHSVAEGGAPWADARMADKDQHRTEARAALAVFEKALGERACGNPTGDDREALRVASPDTGGWDACVVCDSKDVADRGMVVMVSKTEGVYVSRIAWCDESQECRDDLSQTGASMLTEDQAEAVDAALRAANEAQG